MGAVQTLVAAAAFALLAAPAAAVDAGRYAPPSGEFSIAMDAAPDKAFVLDTEQSQASFVFADFKLASGTGTAERTIYWTSEMLPEIGTSLDKAATDFATAYLADRYPSGKFVIGVRARSRTPDGQAYFLFTAQGRYKDVPATWTGVVFFFVGKASVLVSELDTPKAKEALAAAGVTDAEFVGWATSLKLEK